MRQHDMPVSPGKTSGRPEGAEQVSRGTASSLSLPTDAANLADAPRSELAAYLRARYEEKEVSIRDLVAEYGGSYGFVHTLLVESGATLRSRGGARRKQRT